MAARNRAAESAAIKDPAFFRQVRVVPDLGTIVWPNGADFCPDVLFDKSTPAQTQESA